jgi:hypothetical protein
MHGSRVKARQVFRATAQTSVVLGCTAGFEEEALKLPRAATKEEHFRPTGLVA